MTSEKAIDAARNLFHAYDIRIDRSDLDDEVFIRLCDAEAAYFRSVLKTDSVIICRDTREKSSHYLQLAIDRFVESGFRVEASLDPVSTCQFYYSAIKRPDHAGIMITASHNPPEYTGEKIVGLGCEPVAGGVGPAGGLDAIRAFFLDGVFMPAGRKGSLAVFRESDEYASFSIGYAGLEGKTLGRIRILADFMSGSSGYEIMRAFQMLGAHIEAINAVPDGTFPSGTPNPVVRKNIERTLGIAEKMRGDFDFLFIFDGDGDRIAIFDSDLEFISPSVIVSFIADALSSLPGGGFKAGLDSKAVPFASRALEDKGFTPILIPNGHSVIKNMIRNGIISFASEETAHYYLKLERDGHGYPYESTLLVALLFSSCWERDPRPLEKLIALQRSIFSKPEWSCFFSSEEERANAISSVRRGFEDDGYSIQDTLPDGSPLGASIMTKSDEDGWCRLTLRSSQSEKGLMRMMLYASSQALLSQAEERIGRIIKGESR